MSATSRRWFLRRSAAAAAAAGSAGSSRAEPAGEEVSRGDRALAIAHDLHTHTDFSDGTPSIRLHIFEARAFELEAIAITDHHERGSKIADSDEAFDRYLAEIETCRAGQDDVIVLKGVEAAALDATGRISIDERRAARLEWVLCHLGGNSEGTLRKTPADKRAYADNVIRTYLGLCDVPFLHGIAHPFNTGNTKPALLPEDYPERSLRELAAKMAEKGKVFDVMNDTVYWFSEAGVPPRAVTAQYVEVVKLFAAAGVKFQVSSDDHRTGLGNTRWSRIVLARAGVPPHQIVDPRRIRRIREL
jgi:histidinol phosphatase-like PHP family hydrolase